LRLSRPEAGGLQVEIEGALCEALPAVRRS
jgi:hypothetical protein